MQPSTRDACAVNQAAYAPYMPVPPCVSGLQVTELVRLREVVQAELVTAVQHSADWPTLRGLGGVLSEIDRRIEKRSASGDAAENRSRVAATRTRIKTSM